MEVNNYQLTQIPVPAMHILFAFFTIHQHIYVQHQRTLPAPA